MKRYVARRIKYPISVVLCLLCLCLAFAGCNGGGGEETSNVSTDPITEFTTEITEETTEETTEEITEDNTEDTTTEVTEEITTEPSAPETTEEPQPIYASVLVYGADGASKSYPVEVGTTLPTAAFEAAFLPSDTETVKVVFKGWEYSTEQDGERKPYDLGNPPSVEEIGMRIYPVLEYSYLVSFNAGEGSFIEGGETKFFIEEGRKIKPSDLINKMPSKAGDNEYSYPLVGFDIEGKIVAIDAELTVNAPIELTAVYGKTEIEYTVIAHTEIGALPEGGKTFVFKGNLKQAEAFADSYKAYSPEDVYIDNLCYHFKEVFVTREGREWSVELVWESEVFRYSVTFDHGDGNAPEVSYVNAGDVFVLPTDERREDEYRYYDFVGWRDERGYLYNGGYELTVNEDVIFTSEYVPGERKVYAVIFNTDIGVFANGSPDIVLQGYYGDPLTPPNPPAITELTFGEVIYEFAGWSGEIPATFTENASYTAVYTTPEPVYFLNFYLDGELWLRVPHYESALLVMPERPESTKTKIFSGWTDLPQSMPAQDVDLYAVTKNAEVIYILDGEVLSRTPVDVGALVTVAAPAQKHGHTVSGWLTSDIDGLSEGSFIMPERDVCFSAESTPKPHTVTYIIDGVALYTDSVLFGDIYTVRGIEVKVGYEFTGWKIQDNTINTEIGVISIPDADIVFIGGFEVCYYNVNYYLDGVLLYTDVYVCGDTVQIRPDEEMEGCTFAWNCAGADISDGSFIMPAGDVDIYGAFSDGDNKIIFIIDGEEYGSIGVRAGETVTVPFLPSKTGYTFTGWNCNDIDLSSGEFVMPEGDIILRGSFIPNAYDISFIDMATGEIIGTSYLDYGARFSLGDRVYCIEGKISLGWVLLIGDVLRDDDNNYIMPDSEVVFGIVWEECLTLELEEGYWVPYYDHLEYECEGCRYDEQTKTLYISDPTVKVAGASEGVTVVFDYPQE